MMEPLEFRDYWERINGLAGLLAASVANCELEMKIIFDDALVPGLWIECFDHSFSQAEQQQEDDSFHEHKRCRFNHRFSEISQAKHQECCSIRQLKSGAMMLERASQNENRKYNPDESLDEIEAAVQVAPDARR